MNGKERVLAALAHQPTDRAPANYEAHASVSERLKARLGIVRFSELLEVLQVDMRRISFSYWQADSAPDTDGYQRTLWGTRSHPALPDDHPDKWRDTFSETTTVAEVYAHRWPDPAALDYSGIRAQCERVAGKYATYGSPWCPFFHEVGWLIGQETLFMWLTEKPEVIDALLDCVVTYEVEVTRRFLDACDGMLDILYVGNDYGTQRGLVVSPAMWDRFFRRPQKRFTDLARAYGCKMMLHSCGSIRDILPWLIEDGVEIIDPIQVRADGMALDGLHRDFGTALSFHGGVDTQHTLPFGTPDDVRAEVRAYRALTRDHGGYILTGSQQFIDDIPEENILAMYEVGNRE